MKPNNSPSVVEEATMKQDIASLDARPLAASPIERLPSETLGEIFDISARNYAGHIDKARVATFCLVCRPWREAAGLRHSLWGDVTIDRPEPLFDEVVAWLGRSGALSRTLRVDLINSVKGQFHYCSKHKPEFEELADSDPDDDEEEDEDEEEGEDEEEDEDEEEGEDEEED
ncbi:hypothetical protein DFP72DRAFT_1068018 [Ephemerocybe angulata]|uniref:F-box domain-containing protein n=1 Tax=Ephemerocybe angulata TaxID=980116 RepID=A0A8H6HYW4_9AGAR|nr:hypothetical protein DFP72DRAFT_1068018 [Tulosesus angulatus]